MASEISQHITDLEHQTWRALQMSGSDFLPYLDPECIMLFPLGMKITHTTEPSLRQVMTSEAFEPWKTYKMEEVEVIPIGTDGAVISYRAEATKGDRDPVFKALVSSIWRKDSSKSSGRWLLCFHQQTPFTEEL